MNQEQFSALIANLSVGTFLKKRVYDTLTPEQQAQYDVKSAQVAKAFRAANPKGLQVHYAIDTINVTERGYAIVVFDTKAPTRNNVFQFASAYVENMAKKTGIGNVAVLTAVHASSTDDNFLRTTFTVAVKGEEYVNRATGEVKHYESTTLRNTDDAIVLGNSAKEALRIVAMDMLKDAMKGATKVASVNRNRISDDTDNDEGHNDVPEPVVAPIPVAEEAL